MHPRIELIPGLPLHSYGLMLALGLLAGLALCLREGRRLGFTDDFVYNLSFWIMISAILGARVFYVAVRWDEFGGSLLDLFKIWQGGLVFYGGFLGAVIGGGAYLLLKRQNFWRAADMVMPGVAIGLAFGRIGCLMVGCCYGKVCPPGYPFPLTFPEITVGRPFVPLYPTQLISCLNALVLFSILWFWTRKRRPFEGSQTVLFLSYYGITRWIIELYRDRSADSGLFRIFTFSADRLQNNGEFTERLIDKLLAFDTLASDGTTAAFQMTESQVVSVGLAALAVVLFFILRRRPLEKKET